MTELIIFMLNVVNLQEQKIRASKRKTSNLSDCHLIGNITPQTGEAPKI